MLKKPGCNVRLIDEKHQDLPTMGHIHCGRWIYNKFDRNCRIADWVYGSFCFVSRAVAHTFWLAGYFRSMHCGQRCLIGNLSDLKNYEITLTEPTSLSEVPMHVFSASGVRRLNNPSLL